jgi:hypothetical protein
VRKKLTRYKLYASMLSSTLAIVAVSRIHLYMMRVRPAYMSEHGGLFAAFLAVAVLGIVAMFHLIWYLLVEREA